MEETLTNAVETLLGETSSNEEREAAGRWIEEWQSTPSQLPNMVTIMAGCLNQNIVFYAGQGIEQIADNSDVLNSENAEQLIDILQIRLKSNSPELNPACRNQCFRIIASVVGKFPGLLEKPWREIGPENLVEYCEALFEYRERKEVHPQEEFSMALQALVDQNAIMAVLAASPPSASWLVLARYLIQSCSIGTHCFYCLFPFMADGRLQAMAEASAGGDMWPAYISLVSEIINGPETDWMSDEDLAFVQNIIGWTVILAKQAVEGGRPDIASEVFVMVMDFGGSSGFFVDVARYEFIAHVFVTLSECLPAISQIDVDEFWLVLEPISYRLQEMFMLGPGPITECIIKILDMMIFLVNNDPESYMSKNMEEFFSVATDFTIRCVDKVAFHPEATQLVCEFFRRKGEAEGISPGLVYAISSSFEPIRMNFVAPLIENVLSSQPPVIALNFIARCCKQASVVNMEILRGMIQFVYQAMSQQYTSEIAAALVDLTYHFPRVFLESPDNLIQPLVALVGAMPPELFIDTSVALANIALRDRGVTEEQKCSIMGVICGVIEGHMGAFISAGNPVGLFGYLECIMKASKPFVSDDVAKVNDIPYCSHLFQLITRCLGPLWTDGDPAAMEALCYFISTCLDLTTGKAEKEHEVILDLSQVVAWVCGAVTVRPIANHYEILTKILKKNPHNCCHIPFPSPVAELAANVFQVGDSALEVAAVLFVKELVMARWPPFFAAFNPDFLLSTIIGDDIQVVEPGLQIIELIALCPEMQPCLQQMVDRMIQAMLTTFPSGSKSAGDTVVRILKAICLQGICPPPDMIRMVLGNMSVPDGYEAQKFAYEFNQEIARGPRSEPLSAGYAIQKLIDAHRRAIRIREHAVAVAGDAPIEQIMNEM